MQDKNNDYIEDAPIVPAADSPASAETKELLEEIPEEDFQRGDFPKEDFSKEKLPEEDFLLTEEEDIPAIATDMFITPAAPENEGDAKKPGTGLFIILTLFFMYLAGVAVRYYLALKYSMNPSIMPDEGLYSNLARSLGTDFSLSMRSQPLTYDNLLYPALLAPFYYLPEGVNLFRAIQFFNCILMNLAIFPAYFIARRFVQSKVVILGICLGSIALPDFVMTIRIMTEALVYPLFLTTVLFMLRALDGEQKGIRRSAAAGAAAFIMFLGKSGGWGLTIAFGAVLLIWAIRNRDRLWWKHLFAYALTFGLLYFINRLFMTYALGADLNLETVYDQQTGALSLIQLGMTGLGMVLYTFYSIISFGVFPVLIPLCGFDRYNEEKRRQVLFALLSLLFFIIGTAYVIYATEGTSVGFTARIHMRYFFPFIPIFWSMCLDKSVHKTRLNLIILLPLIFVTAILAITGFSSLSSARWAPVDAIHLTHITFDESGFNLRGVAVVMYLALIITGSLTLLRKNWTPWLRRSCGLFIVITLGAANIWGYEINRHNTEPELSADIMQAADILKDDEKVLLISSEMSYFDNYLNLIDIALRKEPYYAYSEDICKQAGDYGVYQGLTLPVYWTENPKNPVGIPDAVVAPVYATYKINFFAGAKKEEIENGNLVVFRPREGERLIDSALVGTKDYIPYGDAAIWIFDPAYLSIGSVTVTITISGTGDLKLSYNGQEAIISSASEHATSFSETFSVPYNAKNAQIKLSTVSGEILVYSFGLNLP